MPIPPHYIRAAGASSRSLPYTAARTRSSVFIYTTSPSPSPATTTTPNITTTPPTKQPTTQIDPITLRRKVTPSRDLTVHTATENANVERWLMKFSPNSDAPLPIPMMPPPVPKPLTQTAPKKVIKKEAKRVVPTRDEEVFKATEMCKDEKPTLKRKKSLAEMRMEMHQVTPADRAAERAAVLGQAVDEAVLAATEGVRDVPSEAVVIEKAAEMHAAMKELQAAVIKPEQAARDEAVLKATEKVADKRKCKKIDGEGKKEKVKAPKEAVESVAGSRDDAVFHATEALSGKDKITPQPRKPADIVYTSTEALAASHPLPISNPPKPENIVDEALLTLNPAEIIKFTTAGTSTLTPAPLSANLSMPPRIPTPSLSAPFFLRGRTPPAIDRVIKSATEALPKRPASTDAIRTPPSAAVDETVKQATDAIEFPENAHSTSATAPVQEEEVLLTFDSAPGPEVIAPIVKKAVEAEAPKKEDATSWNPPTPPVGYHSFSDPLNRIPREKSRKQQVEAAEEAEWAGLETSVTRSSLSDATTYPLPTVSTKEEKKEWLLKTPTGVVKIRPGEEVEGYLLVRADKAMRARLEGEAKKGRTQRRNRKVMWSAVWAGAVGGGIWGLAEAGKAGAAGAASL